MKILVCPLNGPRPVSEFACGGEVRPSPDPDTCSDLEWSDYVFNRSGSPAAKYEWWCHIASGFWFIVLRDTLRDEVIASFPAQAARTGLPPRPALPAAAREAPHDAPPAAAREPTRDSPRTSAHGRPP